MKPVELEQIPEGASWEQTLKILERNNVKIEAYMESNGSLTPDVREAITAIRRASRRVLSRLGLL